MNTKFQPLGKRVLVRYLEAEENKVGKIILNNPKPKERAEVIAIGNKVEGNDIKVGDVVFLQKYTGQQVTLDDQDLIICNIDDLIAKEKDE